MTRPINKKRFEAVPIKQIQLTEDEKEELLDILGYNYSGVTNAKTKYIYEKEEAYIENIEKILGSYDPLEAILDYAPKDSDYRSQLKLIDKKLDALNKTLQKTHVDIVKCLNDDFVDMEELEKGIPYLQQKIKKVIEQKKSKNPGTKKKHGLRLFVTTLIQTYNTNNSSGIIENIDKCHCESSCDVDCHRIYVTEYVQKCLSIIGIPPLRDIFYYFLSKELRSKVFKKNKRDKKKPLS